MKRLLVVLLCLLSLVVSALAYSVPDDTIVYVTPSGTKYHREDCSYIKDSARALTISQAESNGYTPCSRCDPDVKIGAYEPNPDSSSSGSGTPSHSTQAPRSTPVPTQCPTPSPRPTPIPSPEISDDEPESTPEAKEIIGRVLSFLLICLMFSPYIYWFIVECIVGPIRDRFKRKK